MADSFVRVAPDSTGKFIDNAVLTQTGGTLVQRQRTIIGDNSNVNNFLSINASGAALTTFGPSIAQLTQAIISFSSSGDNTIVAAVSSNTTKIYQIYFVVNAATNITFKDGSTSKSGALPFQQGGGMVLDFNGEPWYTGSTNTNFILNSSNAVQVSGTVYYVNS